MEKVLLVYEDFSELSPVETALQKTGFFTLGITNDYTVPEKLISFNPDFVVVFGKAGKVKTSNVGRRLKELVKWRGQVVLIFHPSQRPEAHDILSFRADMILESPVTNSQMVSVLARLSGQDDAPLLEKLNRATVEKMGTSSTSGLDNASASEAPFDAPIVDDNGSPDSHGRMIFLKGEGAAGDIPNRRSDSVSSTDEASEVESAMDELSRLLTPAVEKKPIFQDPALEALLKSSAEDLNDSDSNSGLSAEDLEEVKSLAGGAESVQQHDLAPGILHIQQDLIEAENKSAERQTRYQSFLQEKPLPPPQQTQLRRVEARRALKEMSKNWNKEEVKTQDEYRREFTRALFKKRD